MAAAAPILDHKRYVLTPAMARKLQKLRPVKGTAGQILADEKPDGTIALSLEGDPTLVPLKVLAGADPVWLYFMIAIPSAAEAAALEEL